MKKWLKTFGKWLLRFSLVFIVVIGTTMIGCSLPSLEGRTTSQALAPEAIKETLLGKTIAEDKANKSGLSGVYFLKDAKLSFAAREKLAEQAEKTLDIQYYIWKGDTTGMLMFKSVFDAAERGVRVRLLLDDLGVSGLDAELMALDAHPNIEVRLFNPFLFRPFKKIGFVTDFSRSNRRMHNKTFTVDNTATVLGGRNIGDEYFGATNGVLFADLDAVVIGDVVLEISQSFDEYWHSQSAYPIASIVKEDFPTQQAALKRITHSHQEEHASAYLQALSQIHSALSMLHENDDVHWVPTKFIADPAAKGLHSLPHEKLILHHIGKTLGQPNTSLDVISPYFVPTQAGTDYLVDLAKQGIRVRVVTNSMAATDVLPVHSGYAKYRHELIEAGIELYETKPDPASNQFSEQLGLIGSSGSSLHAKTFSADSLKFFVGSFNFDPRSANFNTELGVVTDDAIIGQEMDEMFEKYIPKHSWRVKINPDTDQLEWHDTANQTVLHNEPHSTWWQRGIVTFLSWLPIEWLL